MSASQTLSSLKLLTLLSHGNSLLTHGKRQQPRQIKKSKQKEEDEDLDESEEDDARDGSGEDPESADEDITQALA